MNPRAKFLGRVPITAATIFVAGLLLTTGRSYAQATRRSIDGGLGRLCRG